MTDKSSQSKLMMALKPIAKEAVASKEKFAGADTPNKIALLGGMSTGVTLGIQGLHNLRSGLAKDERTGKRDLAMTALGAVEAVGGLFLTGMFYKNMHQTMTAFGVKASSDQQSR